MGRATELLTFGEVAALVASRPRAAELIAIDGAPLAGKSTLAARLAGELGLGVVSRDEFLRPEMEWRAARPSWPAPYFRNDELADALRALRAHGRCSYHPYDWERDLVSAEPREVVRDRPIVIEGVGVLDPALLGLYDLTFFVESEPATLWEARTARDGAAWEHHWRDLFLPSVDRYLAGDPRARADFLVQGRGLRPRTASREGA